MSRFKRKKFFCHFPQSLPLSPKFSGNAAPHLRPFHPARTYRRALRKTKITGANQPNGARGKRNFPRAGPRPESGKAAVHIISKKTGAIFRFPETHARGIKIGKKNPQTRGFNSARATCCAFFCARAYRRELSPRLSPRATSAF